MKTVKPGIYPDMPFEEYLSIDALSKSGMVKLDRSPAHFKAPEKPRAAKSIHDMDVGHAFHTATLEPELYRSRYAVTGLSLTTKAGKEFKEEVEAEGKTLIKQVDHINIQAMAKAVHDHPDASILAESGLSEASFFWIDPGYGFLCKCRADKVTTNRMVPDLKSTGDARREAFSKIYFNMKYHWQAYWYLNGISIATGEPHDDFPIVVCERDNPYGVNVFFADPQALLMAMEDIDRLKAIYADCLEKDKWPCYEAGPEYIELPGWATKGR